MPAVESFTVTPLDATFGARIEGVRLATIGDDAFARLYRTWLDYGLLVFPGQHLTQDEQVAFARRFGEDRGYLYFFSLGAQLLARGLIGAAPDAAQPTAPQ